MLYKNPNFKPKFENTSNGRAKILIVTIIALIALLAGVQITLSSQIAVSGDKIKNLETRKNELSLEINRLQVETNKISSLAYIEERARKELEMINGVDKVEYISLEEYLASLK